MDIQQFKLKYIEDATDLLNNLDNDLVNFEKHDDDKEFIEQIFRVMHTLKGTSSMYGFDKIAEITHDLENIFNLVRETKLDVTQDVFDLTLASVDHIRNLLNDEMLTDPVNIEKHGELTIIIHQILDEAGVKRFVQKKKPKVEEIKIRTWQILYSPDEEMVGRAINTLYTLRDLFSLGTYKIQAPDLSQSFTFWSIFLVTDKKLEDIEDALMFISDYCKIQLIADFDIFKEDALKKRDAEIYDQETIMSVALKEEPIHISLDKKDIKAEFTKVTKFTTNRINVDSTKLDTLMYLVSELVTTKSELMLSIENDDHDKIFETAEKIEKLSKLFRDNALSIRLVSMQEMLMRFNRLIRDLSHSLGKKVEFETMGEDTELDKKIIDTIAEPIMHLIRNCIDHGIETTAERINANKKETGIVKFFAYKSGNFVFIQISDDGKGIDTEKVRHKAIDKGIFTEHEQRTNQEIWSCIFLPGFSTAEALTQVSGRGVGMDVVKRKIEELRGEISIDSEKGLGTSFTIKLQQTIAIIDTLLVRCHNSKFAIPIEDIENCEMIDAEILDANQNNQLIYSNELIPYINLRYEFLLAGSKPEKWRSIVIQKHSKRFAIIADEIIGEYQAVIKPLDKSFSGQKFLSGASILGDGSIALLIDTEKLKALMH